MNVTLVGPGRIGTALIPRFRQDGHNVTVCSREAYGDFLAPTFDAEATVATLKACDVVLLLAGRFELNAAPEAMDRANTEAPIRFAEAIHRRFPQAQIIAFLDARILRTDDALPPAIHAYLHAKQKLAAWVLRAAEDWGRATGARVNAIAPGPVLPPPDKAHSEKAGECLTPRPTLEDLYRAMIFLLDTPSVTGQILYVAAGQQLLASSSN